MSVVKDVDLEAMPSSIFVNDDMMISFDNWRGKILTVMMETRRYSGMSIILL